VGTIFVFIIFLKQIFLGTRKCGAHKRNMGGTASEYPYVATGLLHNMCLQRFHCNLLTSGFTILAFVSCRLQILLNFTTGKQPLYGAARWYPSRENCEKLWVEAAVFRVNHYPQKSKRPNKCCTKIF